MSQFLLAAGCYPEERASTLQGSREVGCKTLNRWHCAMADEPFNVGVPLDTSWTQFPTERRGRYLHPTKRYLILAHHVQ